MAFGIKVSKSGEDVKTAGILNLIFSDSLTQLKVVDTGTGTITTNSNGETGQETVTHNLGYRPQALFFLDRESTGEESRVVTHNPVLLTAFSTLATTMDITTTELVVDWEETASSGFPRTYNYVYYVFADDTEVT